MSQLEGRYKKLEIVDEAVRELGEVATLKVNVTDFPDFCLVVADLVGVLHGLRQRSYGATAD